MTCSSCKADVTPVPPRTTWKIMMVAFWLGALATSMMFSLLLGLNVVLVPLWLVIGMSVGIAAQRASSWSCPKCAAELAEPAPEEVTPQVVRPSPVHKWA
jgi:hypothetical protein